MALAYEGLGAAKNVAESCDRAIALGAGNTPLVVQAHQHKGIALQMIGEYRDPKRLSEAEAEFRLALALDPDGAFLHYHLGVVLMQLQRDSEGVEELKKELAVRPRSVHADETARLIDNPRRARELYAPDFSLVTLAREFVELKDLHGKVVVLDFWGTWCPPCVKAVPDLRDLQKKHGKDAFALIGISSDTDEQMLRDFVAKNQMEWTRYLGPRSEGSTDLRHPRLADLHRHRSRRRHPATDDRQQSHRVLQAGERSEAAVEGSASSRLVKAAPSRRWQRSTPRSN